MARRLLVALALVVGCAKSFGSAQLPPKLANAGARQLTATEAALVARNGFVISSEEVPSFHVGYTSVFRSHQSVYFTADALLHAWHSSYDAILASMETSALAPELNAMLGELKTEIAKSSASAETRADVLLYVDVALGLATGKATTKEAAAIVAKAEAAGGEATLDLFGAPMLVDLSMLKPRGHYTHSIELQRYFRAMMWLGRTELRFALKDPKTEKWEVNRRALRGVALLRGSFSPRAERAWHVIDDTTRALVGPADSMSLPGFDRASKGLDLATADDETIGTAFAKEATQKIGSQLLHAGTNELSFLPLGQRYVFDSHVFSALTYGSLKSYRMMPNPLDVGWAVFGNREAWELLGPDRKNDEYRVALEGIAAKRTSFGAELWDGSVHHQWLSAIRELSDTDKSLPAPMQTPAWARRMLNTQLASWAELRHDNLLYAKQSFTAMAMCEYPDAYVDPYPAFYAAMARLADKGLGVVDTLPLQPAQAKQVKAYFAHLRDVSVRLKDIADRERKNEPLAADQLDFMNHMVSIDGRHAGCTTVYEAHGWYADLHFDRGKALYHEPTIADVHTQPTDEAGNTVGKVLHVATGHPRMFAVTLPTCVGPREFRGFVSSYDEVMTRDYQRLTDEEWTGRLGHAGSDGTTVTATPLDVPWMQEIVAH